MKSNESTLAIHHTMAYNAQTHMFSMSHNNPHITRFIIGKGRIIQPKAFKQNQLIFPPKWSMRISKIIGPYIYKRPREWILTDGKILVFFPRETKPLYLCEKCQIKGKHSKSYLCMPWRYYSAKFIGPIRVINALEIGKESLRRISYDYAAMKWIVQKIDPTEFGPVEKAIN